MHEKLILLIICLSGIFYSNAQHGLSIDHLKFIENKGQWNENIRFKADIPNGELILQKDFIGYVLRNEEEYAKALKQRHDHFWRDSLSTKKSFNMQAFKIKFVGANINNSFKPVDPSDKIKGIDPDEFPRNYFIGNDRSKWSSGVKAYNEVYYNEIYKGIDFRLFSIGTSLKYEFLVDAKVDPSKIVIEYEGVNELRIENKQLIIETSVTTIKENAPYAYQEIKGIKHRVECDFQVEGNILTFKLGDYNSKYPLVIDPQLIFSTYSGSTADNWGNTACLDDKGNLYTGGTVFYGTNGRKEELDLDGFPATSGAYETTFQGGDTDIGILKFDSSGTKLLYATYIGGNGTEIPSSLITNPNGELHILAITSSSDFPTSQNSFQSEFKETKPMLDWFVNDKLIYSGYSYNSDTLKNGDKVFARLKTGRNLCPYNDTIYSNAITVNANSTPSVRLQITTNQFCNGDVMTFRAEASNVGNNPVYDWRVNGISKNVNAPVFVTATLNDNDTVYCRLITSLPCNVDTIYSDSIIVENLASENLVSSIYSNQTPLCTGGEYTFRNTSNLSNTLSYQWRLNGVPVGIDSTLTLKDLNEGDQIQLALSSSSSCLNNTSTMSNILIVDNSVKVDMSISVEDFRLTSSCEDFILEFNPKNAGNDPKFKWEYNYSSTQNTYSDYQSGKRFIWENFNPNTNKVFRFTVESSLGCVNSPTGQIQLTTNQFINSLPFDSFSIDNKTELTCDNSDINFVSEHSPIDYKSVGGYIWEKGTDIAIIKLSADGSQLLASTLVGGSQNDGVLETNSDLTNNYGDQIRGDISLDSNGNIYVVSTTASRNFPTKNAFQNEYGGGESDAVIVKLKPDLSDIIWSSYAGGSKEESGMSIVLDENENVFITGGSVSQDFITNRLDSFQTGGVDVYVLNVKNDGKSVMSSVQYGTDKYDQGYFIQKDNEDNLYVLGQTKGLFYTTKGVYKNDKKGIFIHKLNTRLDSTIFSTTLGDTLKRPNVVPNISPTAFLVNECENIFIAGWGGAVNFYENGGKTAHLPITENAYQKTTDSSDFYMMVLHKDADSLLYATYFGGPDSEEHVDGGTSRFDKQGIVYQSVCAGCGGNNDFPLFPTPDNNPDTYPKYNNSSNCNNGVFKYDLANLKAQFTVKQVCDSLVANFQNTTVGGVDFYWDFGDGKDTVTYKAVPIRHRYNKAGTYKVKLIATDLTTCIGKDSMLFNLDLREAFVGKALQDTICQGDSIQLSASSQATGFTYDWFPKEYIINGNTANPTVFPDSTKIYYNEITDDRGCIKTDTHTVYTTLLLDSIVYNLLGSCVGLPSVQFQTKYKVDPTIRYHWNMGDGTEYDLPEPLHKYKKKGKYTVTLEVNNQYCYFKDISPVDIMEVYIPNIFTPNNDGTNDFFEILGIENNGDWKLEVYNRWGKSVFVDETYSSQWNGGVLEDATYYYLLTSPDGATCKGWVQIVH